jgi:hypothetical protein
MNAIHPNRVQLDVHTSFLPQQCDPKHTCISRRGKCLNVVYAKEMRLCYQCYVATKHHTNRTKKSTIAAIHRKLLVQADTYMDAPYFAANYDFVLEATGPEGYRFIPPPSSGPLKLPNAIYMQPAELTLLRKAAHVLVVELLKRDSEFYVKVHGKRVTGDSDRQLQLAPKMVYSEYAGSGGKSSSSATTAMLTTATLDPRFMEAQKMVMEYLVKTGALLPVHYASSSPPPSHVYLSQTALLASPWPSATHQRGCSTSCHSRVFV